MLPGNTNPLFLQELTAESVHFQQQFTPGAGADSMIGISGMDDGYQMRTYRVLTGLVSLLERCFSGGWGMAIGGFTTFF